MQSRELSEPQAPAAAVAIHGTFNDVHGQKVRSGSPVFRRVLVDSSPSSLTDLAQPQKRLCQVGSLPSSPRIQYRPLLTSPRTTPRVESRFLPHHSPGFQQPLSQSISNAKAQSQLVEHLQAFIGRELKACRETLTVTQETFMNKFMASLEARLEANSSLHIKLVTNCGDLEKHVRTLEGNLNEMEQRLSKVAEQQLSKHAEQQLFETQMLSSFEMFEASLRGLHQATSSSLLRMASILCDKTGERRNAVENIVQGNSGQLQGDGGQFHALAKRPSAAPHAATKKCNHVSATAKDRQIASPSPEGRENQQGNGSSSPWTETLFPENSFRVEALEMALASMQQQEQERIWLLQEQIRGRQKA